MGSVETHLCFKSDSATILVNWASKVKTVLKNTIRFERLAVMGQRPTFKLNAV